ncbi:DUF3108 domain-containing protein [Thalassomonas haliotis]|uniref:DUF3108 domain-containing protein n=1 Tax=Thalassomonas haliotis TaxID=485448 RepID=A0ABY7V9R8_9GAMM|nr:DUF3108 domain-containing protein [Thalassomonas haliotis]WDE10056.1 DUF3108 domain-containing protein [Thalassomonas haliotis]
MLKKLYPLFVAALCPSVWAFAGESATKDIAVKPFTASYSIIHKDDPVGTASRQLSYQDDGSARYSYSTDIEWLIFSDTRKESSIVQLKDNKVIPKHYKYDREGTGRNKHYEWQYDVAGNSAFDVKEQQAIKADFSQNLQDPLSYHLQNRLNLLAHPEQKHFVYPVIKSSGKIKNYVYQYDGEEELLLPYGIIKTVKFKREVVDKKRITYAWFAPELDYLLVKLFQVKAGVKQFEAQLTELKVDGKVVTASLPSNEKQPH